MPVVPAEVFKCLHASRLAHYRAVAGGQDADALALYEWNIELASALQDPLGIAEVAVRHAIDTQLSNWSQQHGHGADWINYIAHIPYLSGPAVFTTTRHKLYKAADQSRRSRPASHPRHGDAITHDDLVAHVMFGTWASLLPEKFDASWVDPNGNPVQNQVNLQARRDLWRNCLHGGFPNVKQDPRGYGTGNKVRDLRKLRNRVSHMDSLLYVDVKHLHDRVLLPLLNSISYDLHDWVDGRSQVRANASSKAGKYNVMTYRRICTYTSLRHTPGQGAVLRCLAGDLRLFRPPSIAVPRSPPFSIGDVPVEL